VQHVIYNICSASFPPMINNCVIVIYMYLFSLTMSFMLMLLLPEHTGDNLENRTREQCLYRCQALRYDLVIH